MAIAPYDIPTAWQGKDWQQDVLRNFGRRASLFPLFSNRTAPLGTKTIVVGMTGARTAQQKTPGDGNLLSFVAGTQGSVEVAIDQHWYDGIFIDEIEDMQSAIMDREARIESTVNTLLGKVDSSVVTALNGYVGLHASHSVETAEGSQVAATPSAISAEIESLVAGSMVILDDDTNGLGPGSGPRHIGLDSYLFWNVVGGSAKQSPERTDLLFGYSAGAPNPMFGATVHNFGVHSVCRTLETYAGSDVTAVEFYVFHPDALAVGVQNMLRAAGPEYKLEYDARLMTMFVHFGIEEALARALVKCTIRIAGNPLGLS